MFIRSQDVRRTVMATPAARSRTVKQTERWVIWRVWSSSTDWPSWASDPPSAVLSFRRLFLVKFIRYPGQATDEQAQFHEMAHLLLRSGRQSIHRPLWDGHPPHFTAIPDRLWWDSCDVTVWYSFEVAGTNHARVPGDYCDTNTRTHREEHVTLTL